jgi:hypothetical protein
VGWSFNKELLSTYKRFEIDGADIARAFVEKYKRDEGPGAEDWDGGRVQTLWDVIAREFLFPCLPYFRHLLFYLPTYLHTQSTP